MLPSELFAISQSVTCEGDQECHYCAGPCKRLWTHNDPGPRNFRREKHYAKRPNNPYTCMGCYLWHRKRITVPFLDKGNIEKSITGYRDGQCALHHSWLITEKGAWGLRSESANRLYQFLLSPTSKHFIVSLIDISETNHLQQCVVNTLEDGDNINKPFSITFNGTPMRYSIYELETALKDNKTDGREAGVRKLIEVFGPYAELQQQTEEERGKGRPKKELEAVGSKMNKQIKQV